MTLQEAIEQGTARMNEDGRPSHYVIVKDRKSDDYDWIPAAFLDDISYTGSRQVVQHLHRTYDPIQVLAGKRVGDRGVAVYSLVQFVLAVSVYGDPDGSLMDWISAGDYTGSEMVKSIAAEWDRRDE